MNKLSSPVDKLLSHYDVLVIGSGYGGSIAANRFARARQENGQALSVALLERGREIQPGEYPDNPVSAGLEMGVDTPTGKVGRSTAMFDLRINEDMHVLVGRGLGGTSLINANAVVLPDPRVFQGPRWPSELRSEATHLVEQLASTGSHAETNPLAEGFSRARQMLHPQSYPVDWPLPKKLDVLRSMATTLGGQCVTPPINVWFGKAGPNHLGVPQSPCVGCGDCMTGCNHRSKNTLLMNYLPNAVQHGAHIFTELEVSHLERNQDGWIVWYRHLDVGQENFGAPLSFVRAGTVVLAAGSLGSTEILLRSKAHGLPTSDCVGHHFTGNGDVLAFAYNIDAQVNGIGTGADLPAADNPVGPCITGMIDLRHTDSLDQGLIIEDGTIPGALAMIAPAVLGASASLVGQETPQSWLQRLRNAWRRMESWIRGPHHGATGHTQTLLVMGHDNSAGEIRLINNRPTVVWPGVGSLPIFTRINTLLSKATLVAGGIFVRNPIWSRLTGKQLVTVHPLGGCAVADDASSGVVNHRGLVFKDTQGSSVYPDLLVLDGAIVPRPLGVNPLFTISALAERACALFADEKKWLIDYDLPLPQTDSTVSDHDQVGIRFTERMAGFVSLPDLAASADKTAEMTITVESDDLDALLESPTHAAGISGTVLIPALSSSPLAISAGEFKLFPCETGNTRTVNYQMRITATDGKSWQLLGEKRLHDDPDSDLWEDATTLYYSIMNAENSSDRPLATGILRIHNEDLLAQLRSMKITTDGADWLDRINAGAKLTRLVKFIAGNVWAVYGNKRA